MKRAVIDTAHAVSGGSGRCLKALEVRSIGQEHARSTCRRRGVGGTTEEILVGKALAFSHVQWPVCLASSEPRPPRSGAVGNYLAVDASTKRTGDTGLSVQVQVRPRRRNTGKTGKRSEKNTGNHASTRRRHHPLFWEHIFAGCAGRAKRARLVVHRQVRYFAC